MSGLAAELEQELETEFEQELELAPAAPSERQAEAFFNHLAAMADRGGRSQALRRVAVAAAREALRGAARPAPAIEGELELETELAGETELELELDPARRQNLDAMLEHMAHAASEAATEQEAAEQFLPLIPLAAKFALPLLGKALPGAAKAVMKLAPRVLGRVAPTLSKGVGNLARALHRNRSTRPLLRAVPRIARTTVTSLGRRIASGRRVTPRIAAQILARQTARTLGSPRALTQCYRRSRVRDAQYHRRSQRVVGRPRHTHAPRLCPTCGRAR